MSSVKGAQGQAGTGELAEVQTDTRQLGAFSKEVSKEVKRVLLML
jgi:hypothetical protein